MNYAAPSSQPSPDAKPQTSSALDVHPFGCIKLSKAGRVLELNIAAAALVGVCAADALGKCFFTQIAPCSGNAAFHGRFKTAMAGNGVLNKVLDHRFLLSNAPQPISAIEVRVHMFSSVDADGLPIVWVLTRKKLGAVVEAMANTRDRIYIRQQASQSRSTLPNSKPIYRPRIQNISSQFDISI